MKMDSELRNQLQNGITIYNDLHAIILMIYAHWQNSSCSSLFQVLIMCHCKTALNIKTH